MGVDPGGPCGPVGPTGPGGPGTTGCVVAGDGDVSSVVAVKMHFDQQNEVAPSHIYFADAAAGEIAELDLTPNVISLFRPLNGVANPYTGNPIVNGYVSNSSLVNPGKLQLLALFDSTP